MRNENTESTVGVDLRMLDNNAISTDICSRDVQSSRSDNVNLTKATSKRAIQMVGGIDQIKNSIEEESRINDAEKNWKKLRRSIYEDWKLSILSVNK